MSPHQRAVFNAPPEGWSFTVTEVANGAYRARGIGPDGLAIERHGTDDSRLLDQLIEDALKLAVQS